MDPTIAPIRADCGLPLAAAGVAVDVKVGCTVVELGVDMAVVLAAAVVLTGIVVVARTFCCAFTNTLVALTQEF
jgi:hypothetical protein